MSEEDNRDARRPARAGWIVKASYRDPVDDVEVGNPLLLALPPTRSLEEWTTLLNVEIPNVERDRMSLDRQ